MSTYKPTYFKFWKSQFWYDRQLVQEWRKVPNLIRAMYGIVFGIVGITIIKFVLTGKIHGIWRGIFAAACFLVFGLLATILQQFLIEKYGQKEE